jgi:Predicted integral membrane protein (DUF2269)
VAQFLPLILGLHIVFAVGLLVPSILLPFALRARAANREPGRVTRGLIRLQRDLSIVIGVALIVTGIGLLLIVGPALLAQPWLVLALIVYAADLLIAFAVQRPGLRRLLGLRADATDDERKRWRTRARRQRYISYVMASAVGLIAFLMTAKPKF